MRPGWLLAAIILTALTGTAHAQNVPTSGLTVELKDPGRAFQPGAVEGMELYVTYRFPSGATPAPDANEPPNYVNKTRIAFEVKTKPSWVSEVTFQPTEVWLEPPANSAVGGNQATPMIRVLLQIMPDAPALQREPLVVIAHASANGNIAAATGQSAEQPLRVAEVAKLNVTSSVGASTVIAGGRWSTVPFTITNQGNDATRALINVTLKPENSEVEFPKEVDLARDESVVINVRIRTPWTESETGTLELEAIPLLDDDEGRPARYAVDISATSAVPLPPALLLSLPLGALLRKRTRTA